MDVGLQAQVAGRLILFGAMLSAISSVLNVLGKDRRDRVLWISLGWATLVLVQVCGRLLALQLEEAALPMARLQYAAVLLHAPLALALVLPEGRLAIAFTAAVGLVPIVVPAFLTGEVILRADALSVPIRYPLPGALALGLVPYGAVVAARVVRAAWSNPDIDPFIRKLLVLISVVEVPAGTNDLLMTLGRLDSILVSDAASCAAVAGFMVMLARRSTVAYTKFLQALAEQREALAHGAHDARVARKLGELGIVVERAIQSLAAPMRDLAIQVSVVNTTIRGLAARRDDATLRETSTLSQEAADAVRRMEGTLRELSDFAGPHETVRERCDVWEVLERALRIVQNDLVHRARVLTKVGPAPSVMADRARLVEVFVHLLQSAVASISPARWGAAQITLSLGTDDHGCAVVRVADDGDPVPEEGLLRLFDPYASSSSRSEGTAFRLAICHRIVTSIGGRIGVESGTPGTTVTVTLPATAS